MGKYYMPKSVSEFRDEDTLGVCSGERGVTS
jgi:hypothetical protein